MKSDARAEVEKSGVISKQIRGMYDITRVSSEQCVCVCVEESECTEYGGLCIRLGYVVCRAEDVRYPVDKLSSMSLCPLSYTPCIHSMSILRSQTQFRHYPLQIDRSPTRHRES